MPRMEIACDRPKKAGEKLSASRHVPASPVDKFAAADRQANLLISIDFNIPKSNISLGF